MAEEGILVSIIGLLKTGSRLSLGIFDFASSMGRAGKELQAVGTEVTLFCSVMKQLQIVLGHARFTYSSIALDATQRIIDRCQVILEDIHDVVATMRKEQDPTLVDSVDYVARVQWTFKRSKVQVLRSTLESCKLTLHVLLTTMEYAQKVSTRQFVTALTAQEDEQDRQMIQALIIAQQCSLDQLEKLEEENEKDEDKAGRLLGVGDTAPLRIQDRKLDKLSALLGNLPVTATAFENPISGNSQRRVSTWLSDTLVGDDLTVAHPGGLRMRRLSSAQTSQRPTELLKKWTDQADNARAQKQLAELSEGTEGMNDNFSFSEPSLAPIDETTEQYQESIPTVASITNTASADTASRASSVAWPLPKDRPPVPPKDYEVDGNTESNKSREASESSDINGQLETNRDLLMNRNSGINSERQSKELHQINEHPQVNGVCLDDSDSETSDKTETDSHNKVNGDAQTNGDVQVNGNGILDEVRPSNGETLPNGQIDQNEHTQTNGVIHKDTEPEPNGQVAENERPSTYLKPSPESSRQTSIVWPMPSGLSTDLPNGHIDAPNVAYSDVLSSLMREYGATMDTRDLVLAVAYGGHIRNFHKSENPLGIAQQLEDFGLHPHLFVRKIESESIQV